MPKKINNKKIKKTFKFKESHSNIEKLFHYAKHQFPKLRRRLEYDEWGAFVFFKKSDTIHYFYYVKNNGDLYFNAYKNCVAKMDKLVITGFKHKVYNEISLMKVFDKILKPLTK